MSKEHDGKRFDPSLGDKISIAGEFNSWTPDSLFLLDPDGGWIYSLELPPSAAHLDTLVFRFKITPGKGHSLVNEGWEHLLTRRIALREFSSEKPLTLTFNEVFDNVKTINVVFTVGVRNQQVLGFFNPQKGDEVIVSGSFCDWRADGFPMQSKNDDGIYTVTLPIKGAEGKPVEYKFRFLNYRKAILPNRGWESIPNRNLELSSLSDKQIGVDQVGESLELPYAEFNDLRRVARFIVHTQEFENTERFNPKKGDILQVMVDTDGKEVLSDPLMRVRSRVWEVAMSIPLTAQHVKWKLVRNLTTPVSELSEISIGPEGKLVEVN